MRFTYRQSRWWVAAFFSLILGAGLFASCAKSGGPSPNAKGTRVEAEEFIKNAEKNLFDLTLKYSRADWVKSTFITDDTEALSADANNALIAATTELAEQSKRFDGLDLSPDTARKIKLLKLSLTLPAPKDPAERDEVT
jgi:peptidyl-dipeptidase A